MVISKLEKDVKIPYNLQKIKTKVMDTSTLWIHSEIKKSIVANSNLSFSVCEK